MATGLELAMESARIRHDAALDRKTAVHLFSDYLPFHQSLRSWLIERKLERDFEPLQWTREATITIEDLKSRLGSMTEGERRADGLYLGEVTSTKLEDEVDQQELLARLAGAYVALDPSSAMAPTTPVTLRIQARQMERANLVTLDAVDY